MHGDRRAERRRQGPERPPRQRLHHPWVGAVKPSGRDGEQCYLFDLDSDSSGPGDRWLMNL